MRKSKNVTWFMVFAFIMATMFGAVAPVTAAGSLNDISGHWAQNEIESLVAQNVVNGYPDGSFKPENTITRAEFITIVNKAFNFSETADIDYADVKSSDWFAGEIARANAAGYISGYQDGTMKPNNQISRQEVAVIMAKVLKLDMTVSNDSLSQFKDVSSIPAWSKPSLAAVVQAGLIKGYPDGTVKAGNSIKRAEAVVIVSQAIKPAAPPVKPPQEIQSLYDKAGTYGLATGTQTINKDVTISADGVVLQNTTIKGNLLIAEAVGAGNVTLKNVTVTGTTTIKGGGENSITFDNCKLGVVKADKANGKLRVVLSSTTISEFIANSGVNVVGNGTIDRATVNKNGVTIGPKPGSFTIAPGVTAIIAGKTEKGSAGGGGGGGGSPGTPTGPTVVNDLAAGNYSGDYKITSTGTKGPATGKAIVTGTLYLDPGATGSINLRNVEANKVEVLSGAPNTIVFLNVTVTNTLTINTGSQSQPVRIQTQGTTAVAQTIVSSNVMLDQDSGSLGSIQVNATVDVTFDGNFSTQTVTVAATASGAGVNVSANSIVGNVTTTVAIRIDNSGTINTVTTTVTVVISGTQPETVTGGGTVIEAPSISNVKVGEISPTIGFNASGILLTFLVDPIVNYNTGTATLSTDVSYRIQSGSDINVTGTATTTDNLADRALVLLQTQSSNPTNTGVMGLTLINQSPVVITLTSATPPNPVTVYTVNFVSTRPLVSNISIGTATGTIYPVMTWETTIPVLTFNVDPTASYTRGTLTLSEDVSYNIKNPTFSGDGINGSAEATDDLMQLALDLLALKGGSPGDGVLGSTLINNSPLTITLTGARDTTTARIVFE